MAISQITSAECVKPPETVSRANRSQLKWAVAIGSLLFVVAHLAVLSGFLFAPKGYKPAFLIRQGDVGEYFTWLAAAEGSSLLPDYHAP